MVCGRAGVCNRGNCSCAREVRGSSEFFTPVNETELSLGCKRVYPYSCKDARLHTFLDLENTTFLTFNSSLSHVSAETCKSECLKKCDCKVVLFRYAGKVSGQERKKEVTAVAGSAQRCLNLQGRMRPTMKEVPMELESVRRSQMPATSSADNGFQETRFDESKMMMISDFEYKKNTCNQPLGPQRSN